MLKYLQIGIRTRPLWQSIGSGPIARAVGLGLAGSAIVNASDARKNNRGDASREDDQNGNSNKASKTDKEAKADERKDEANSESKKSDGGKDGDRGDRNQKSNDQDDQEGKTRSESKSQDTESSAKDNSDRGRDRDSRGSDRDDESEDLAQRSDRDLDDEPDPTPTPVTAPPSNPNVAVPPSAPADNSVDLIVQSNPDVIAQVGARGGFAFARSDGVTVVSGPDGAKIIQSGTAGAPGAPAPTPVPNPTAPPADGGDNNVDFAS